MLPYTVVLNYLGDDTCTPSARDGLQLYRSLDYNLLKNSNDKTMPTYFLHGHVTARILIGLDYKSQLSLLLQMPEQQIIVQLHINFTSL